MAASLLSTSPASAPSPPRALPPLPHILPALRDALSSDPLWGADQWPHLLSRATQLCAGMQALMAECVELESLVESPGMQEVKVQSAGQGVRLRKSKLAKRQLRLEREEVELMRRVAMQCWARAKLPKAVRGEMLGGGESGRRRSLTCP